MAEPGEVTRLLAGVAVEGRSAMDRVFPLVYEELRRVAHRHMRRERTDHTLDTTSLVHEAYLRLSAADSIEWRSRSHFFAVAARAMRRILINYAEARSAQKRGGDRRRVPLAEGMATQPAAADGDDQLLALDRALTRLAALNERQCQVVECRYFGGMSIDETAVGLDISPATVKRDWTLARAWLHRELGRG